MEKLLKIETCYQCPSVVMDRRLHQDVSTGSIYSNPSWCRRSGNMQPIEYVKMPAVVETGTSYYTPEWGYDGIPEWCPLEEAT